MENLAFVERRRSDQVLYLTTLSEKIYWPRGTGPTTIPAPPRCDVVDRSPLLFAISLSVCPIDNSRRLRSFANHPHRMDINWLAPIPHFRLQRHFSFLVFSSPWTFFRYVHDAVKWEMTTDAKDDHQTSFSFVCECVSYFLFFSFWLRMDTS